MLSYYMGLALAPHSLAPKSLTGLSWITFKNNWNPKYLPGQSFSSAISLFFPCFTGILRYKFVFNYFIVKLSYELNEAYFN